MKSAVRSAKLKSSFISLTFLCVAYFLLLPSLDFRGDDWSNLESVRPILNGDWREAFRPSRLLGETREPWFFRPAFKYLLAGFYQLAGLHYAAWIALVVVLYALTLAMASELLTHHRRNSSGFLFFAVVSFPLHMGSLLWVAEGLMNIPELLGLVLGIAAISYPPPRRSGTLAALVFLATSTVKESAFFHPLLYLAFHYLWRPEENSVKRFAPVVMAWAGYAVLRFSLPLNAGYVPQMAGALWGSAFSGWAYMLFALLLFAYVLPRQDLKSRFADVLMGAYLFCAVTIQMGHPFFSPAWLTVPSIATAFYLAMRSKGDAFKRLPLVVYGVFSLLILLLFAREISYWKAEQLRMTALLQKHQSAEPASLILRDCPINSPSASLLSRAVGGEESLNAHWRIIHGRIGDPVWVLPCREKK